MKKYYILKKETTGEYFTKDYKCWWSHKIQDAYLYDNIPDSLVCDLLRDPDEPISLNDFIIVVTVFCR